MLFSRITTFEDFAQALQTQQVPVTMIVLGSVILLISFFGCCGAIRESYCMSMTVSCKSGSYFFKCINMILIMFHSTSQYSILLFVLMIGQLALVAYMWLQKDKYLVMMDDVVEKAWQRKTEKADFMDGLQISVSCNKFRILNRNFYILRKF